MRPVTHLERVALRKMKAPAVGFMICRFERLADDASLLSGGPTRILKRGPRAGREICDKITAKVTVTSAEIEVEELAYEKATGDCHKCYGKGQEWAGWSAADGNRYKECARCKGTGKAVL